MRLLEASREMIVPDEAAAGALAVSVVPEIDPVGLLLLHGLTLSRMRRSTTGELLLHTPNHAFITFSYPKLLNHTPSPKKGV